MNLRGGAWVLPMNWKNDAEAFERDLERLPIYATAAARLGLASTGTWVRFETDPVEGVDRLSDADRARLIDQATAWQLERLGRIARILDDHGSRLGLEIIGSPVAPTGRGVRLVGTYAELGLRFGRLAAKHTNVGVLVERDLAFLVRCLLKLNSSLTDRGWLPMAAFIAGAIEAASCANSSVT